MIGFIKRHRIAVLAVVIILATSVALSVYRDSLTEILDRSEFSAIAKDIKNQAESGVFTDQAALSGYITKWADTNNLEYKTDDYGNIIFVSKAVERKKNVSPTVVCVSYNYETVKDNAKLLASAVMIARTELKSGRKTVIFVNDEQNKGTGYRKLSKKYFKNKAKVIYMDYGQKSYMSCSSFGMKKSVIKVKAGRFEPVCDTAVKVHISGINSDVIGTEITKQPDPVNALSTLLTRLKSKSAIFQLADFEIGTNGNMYPVSMDATIMLNSYALPSFTKYIDKRIKAWEKSYGNSHENLSYTYEVIDDPEQLPEMAYSRKATAKLTNVLYTLKSGLYKYERTDDIPEGVSEGDIFGINSVTGIRSAEGAIYVDIITQASDDESMQRITDDNTASAELFECTIAEKSATGRFLNDKDSLSRTFTTTYYRVNSTTSVSSVLSTEADTYFTPCSFLAAKNSKADVIHLHMNSEQAQNLTNTILCYIAYKGNLLI